jgi:diguanylate cyclase (GGDEF)-like protein
LNAAAVAVVVSHPAASAAAGAAASDAALIERAWELSYLDPQQAGGIGRRVAEAGGALAGWGWLHLALSEARSGESSHADRALSHARALFDAGREARGLALCDEVLAIQRRRDQKLEDAWLLQREIDGRSGIAYTAHDRFLAHNSRAITHKLMVRMDEALQHFYAAGDAAQATGWAGPRITALGNLGGYHHDLFNLEDARTLSEQALQAARAAGARPIVAVTATNLILIHHASQQPQRAREVAGFLLSHPHELMPGALERVALPLALGHLAVGEIDAAQHYLDRGAVAAVGDGDGITFWAWLQARCALARGDLAGARDVAEHTLRERQRLQLADQPYDLMELHRAAADACEQLGDHAAALAYVRRAHQLYEELVGRSARARYVALQAQNEMSKVQRERDLALDTQRSVEDDRRRLTELNRALQAKVAETEMLHTQLREQALRDPLTGLHNRRYLFEFGPSLLELCRRQGSTACVVLLDLDHFKLLNDTYGHHAGDAVLQRFATLLQQMFRRSDVVCRHGGEEFVAVMPDIDGEGAEAMLTRLLDAYQSQPQELGRRRLPSCSFSAGIALFPRHGSTLEQLLSRADRALYAAKHHGRARIEQVPMTGFSTLT